MFKKLGRGGLRNELDFNGGVISASTPFQSNQVPASSNTQGVVTGNVDRQNETARQRRPQEQPAGPFQPPGTDGYNIIKLL